MNFNQTNNNQGDVINIQDAKDINSDVKWGQYHNDHILMSENQYALVQIEPDGLVVAQIGRRFCDKPSPRKLMPFFEDYYHARWFDGVKEAKQWSEKQLFLEAKNES